MDDHKVVIQAESLSKRYGRVLALDGLNLEVRAGEVLGFLGPNGAGKTTTMRRRRCRPRTSSPVMAGMYVAGDSPLGHC